MKIAIRHPKDFFAGLLFAAIGLSAAAVASNYPIGSLFAMGAGYFPVVLSVALAVLGLALMLRALLIQGAPVGGLAWKPLMLVLAAVVAFGVLLRPLGLIVASVVLVLVSSFARERWRWREIVILALVLAAVSWAVFVLGLKLPFTVLPG